MTKIYKLKPLAVTFSHNWFSKIGRENLKNMTERLSVDLIEFTPNRNLVNKLAKKSLDLIGDSLLALSYRSRFFSTSSVSKI